MQDASYAGENPHIVVSEARDYKLKFKPGINFENIKTTRRQMFSKPKLIS